MPLGATAESFFELLDFGQAFAVPGLCCIEGEVIKRAAIAKCLGRK